MILIVPALVGAAMLACLFKPSGARCNALTDEQNDALDRTLTMSPSELVSAGQAEGRSAQAVAADLRSAAAFVGSRGCPDDARRLRLKAATLAAMAATFPGAFASSFEPAALPSPSSQKPIIARMRCGQERCSVRPEPRPWDDTQGRFGFTIPAGWPVGVTAFEPFGWAEVSLDHPDHGRVAGFVELAKLVTDTNQGAAPAVPQPVQPSAPAAQPSTGNCPGGVCPIPGAAPKAAAPSFGGGSKFMPSRPTAAQRTRTRMQKLNTKRRAASA